MGKPKKPSGGVPKCGAHPDALVISKRQQMGDRWFTIWQCSVCGNQLAIVED